MTFKCRFNATCFLFKINRFVLIFSKTSNRFVLKICSGGFADYTSEPAVKARIYYFLYEENVAKKEYEDAVTYLSHYVLLSDTLRSQINRSEYLEIQKKYDQVVLLNKNVEIHNHWYLTIIISTVIIVALIGIHYLVLSINRKKKEKLLLKSKQEKVELQEKIDACQTKIAEDETMHNEEK